MKIHPQTIYLGSRPEFIVLPINEYKKLLTVVEDSRDIQEVKEHLDSPGETFPLEVVLALTGGKNSIKVYREYRGISQVALAKKVNVSKQYICQLENGQRQGTARVLKSIAKALKIDVDMLINV